MGMVHAIVTGDDDSPTALRLTEGAAIAYITHADQSASVFVNGARVAVLRETAAVAYLPRLCASSRVEARDLIAPFRESPELRKLVEEMMQADLLWAEL